VIPVRGDASILAIVLSNLLGRPVFDQTGIPGFHDFTLQVAREEQVASLVGSSAGAPGGSAAPSSIFTALQDQLGLKLEAKKGPVEVLVIDRVERPSEN
jgi:uncharacterized protein (TIGR03435 family)